MLSKGIVHYSSFLGFTPLLLFVVVITSKFISIIKLFLSQSMVMGMTFFSVFFPIPLGKSADWGERTSVDTPLLDGVKPGHHIKPFNYTSQ